MSLYINDLFIHTRDKRMFLIGRQPVINTVYDQPARHKQARTHERNIRFARSAYVYACVNARDLREVRTG